jgi:hypothetical protein
VSKNLSIGRWPAQPSTPGCAVQGRGEPCQVPAEPAQVTRAEQADKAVVGVGAGQHARGAAAAGVAVAGGADRRGAFVAVDQVKRDPQLGDQRGPFGSDPHAAVGKVALGRRRSGWSVCGVHAQAYPRIVAVVSARWPDPLPPLSGMTRLVVGTPD